MATCLSSKCLYNRSTMKMSRTKTANKNASLVLVHKSLRTVIFVPETLRALVTLKRFRVRIRFLTRMTLLFHSTSSTRGFKLYTCLEAASTSFTRAAAYLSKLRCSSLQELKENYEYSLPANWRMTVQSYPWVQAASQCT